MNNEGLIIKNDGVDDESPSVRSNKWQAYSEAERERILTLVDLLPSYFYGNSSALWENIVVELYSYIQQRYHRAGQPIPIRPVVG